MRSKNETIFAWDKLLAFVNETDEAKYVALIRTIGEWIDTGRLPVGAKLPPTRELAERLGIGRNTAMRAFATLAEQGYLDSRQRSGVFVANVQAQRANQPSHEEPETETASIWRDRPFRTASATARLPNFEKSDASTIRFRGVGFDIGLFPVNQWRECERAALGVVEIAEWGSDMVERDDPELVSQLRTRLLPKYGIWAREDEILVTMGAQEARYLVARLLGSPGVTAGIEEPGLPDTAAVFEVAGCVTRPLEMDDEGVLANDQLDGCSIVALTSNHQYPTTAVMSLSRREELLKLAEKHDFIILEDMIETELLFDASRRAALKSFDRHGRVITIGTLTRHIAPGLRIGYLVASAEVIAELRRLRRLIHRHAPGNNQRAMAIFMARGHYSGFLRRASKALERRANRLLEVAAKMPADIRWRHQAGAASFWCTLPPGVDGDKVAEQARAQGVVVEPGSNFFHFRRQPHGFLRLSTANVNETQIGIGIDKLSEIIQGLRTREG